MVNGVVAVQVLLVMVLFLSLLIAVFALQNQELVQIRLLFWEFWVSKILVILGSALLGAMAVLFAGVFRRRKRIKETAPAEPKAMERKGLFRRRAAADRHPADDSGSGKDPSIPEKADG